MTDESVSTKHKRRPWAALILSLIMPGLGHIYSGRFLKGLVFLFLCFIPITLLQAGMIFEVLEVGLIGVFALLTAVPVIHLVAIVDSYYVAKRTKPDYELKDYNRWYVYVILVVINTASSLDTTLSLRANYLEAFRVPTASNYPTIVPGDRFLANKIAYKRSDPRRGDVVVFANPENRRIDYVKRVVAVAGDTVEIKDGRLYVNGVRLQRQTLARPALDKIGLKVMGRPLDGDVFYETNGDAKYKIFLAGPPHDKAPTDFARITIGEHHCFVLGDNRNMSHDSRHFGPVPLATVKGRADYLYFPAEDWSRFGRIDD
jgi:signal peptidase I